jgi:hypothetical protein
LSGRRRCRSGDGNHFSPVFLITTWRLGLPAAGGEGGAQVAGPGNRGSVFPRFFWDLSWSRQKRGAQKGGRMMIIAKRGKATQTSYSTAGRALAESIN